VYEPNGKGIFTTDDPIKGSWNERFFDRPRPIVLELGCGKGEYTTGLAARFDTRNYIGVDIKGNRMWKGARRALEENLKNVAFLRTRIEFINRLFAPGEVDEIWITFPDPQQKKAAKRLTSSGFLSLYRQILRSGGTIHLKTDSRLLYDYTLALLHKSGISPIMATDDLYQKEAPEEVVSIKTFYEEGFLAVGQKITYIRFSIPDGAVLLEPDHRFR